MTRYDRRKMRDARAWTGLVLVGALCVVVCAVAWFHYHHGTSVGPPPVTVTSRP